ncbi:hypothetical protein [Herbaspirillum sp. SJZ107]|uniref:hypothetical protein n=1 Tax=Herbaspirillum sp. SJZ107 TaxID=2572881 RepID=UPI001154665F|nr:hypothetical protein [Herbaspirillum sp. SJZ107]TQK11479.1 hypothetical protein FBX97_1426 [Herbaspirillum sp. SJZ107]
MNDTATIDKQTRTLAAMAYGEASTQDIAEEMNALASVLVRQRDARGYSDIMRFASSEPSFSFVVADGNVRYKKLMKASVKEIMSDPGMSAAISAANNALAGGQDASNGAYFWDGADIKSNYKKHAKVRHGIRFANKNHNVYSISESSKLTIVTETITKKSKGKVISTTVNEIGRYDHVYVSTAAYGGTIFWKLNPEYVKINRAKEYK